ncbi:ribosome modulation factor [Phaeospirillum tilakii]|uniref:Uncharacterized protein n=1 Tax=Phaeospirillum tilakii TaxID=741673 RepID=A0ABW5C794_9PROT
MSQSPAPAPSPDDEIYGLARAIIDTHVAAIDEARQAKDDGTTGHASAWKAAKKVGLPVDPLKLCLKLKRMSESKRRDFLRGFDALRISYFGWDNQLDMFEASRSTVEAEAAEAEPESAVEAVEDAPEPVAAPAIDQDGIKAKIDRAMEAAKDAVALAPETDPEADHAGTAFNQGRMAALAGQTGEQNPYKRASLRGRVWAQGHAKGVAERAAKQFEGDAAASNVVALPVEPTALGDARPAFPH